MGVTIAFWVLAVAIVGSALAVVVLRNVFRAALFLVLCFFGVAGIFITLQADFIAVVQVLIYVGAIAILLIFVIMLTQQTQQGSPSNKLRYLALPAAGIVLAIMIAIVVTTNWVPQVEGVAPQATTGPIAEILFKDYLLPFEVASVLLLAAIIGAIVLVRER